MAFPSKTLFFLFSTMSFLSSGYGQDTIVPAIITFGDSGLDVGNNNYLPTHFKSNYPPYGKDFVNHKATGRFCNGKLVSDINAETLGFKTYVPAYLSPEASGKNLVIGANFASAASGFDDKAAYLNHAITLTQQLEHFKEYKFKLTKVAGGNKSASIIKDALYLLSAGTSDFLQKYHVIPQLNKAHTPDQYGSTLVNSFTSFVKSLYGLGARRLGVTSIPPLGCYPAAMTLYRETRCISGINSDVQRFNQKLNSTATNLRKQFPDLKLVVFDIFNPLYDVIQSPSKYGFVEARKGCCRTRTGIVETTPFLCNLRTPGTCSNSTQYVFWDNVHLSEAANMVLADAIISQSFALI